MITKTTIKHPLHNAAGINGDAHKKRLVTTVVYKLFNIIPIWMVRNYEIKSREYIQEGYSAKKGKVLSIENSAN